jgi:hypothetical protein
MVQLKSRPDRGGFFQLKAFEHQELVYISGATRPLGLAVIGELIVSQSLTLYITPVFYVYMEKFKDWVGRRKKIS